MLEAEYEPTDLHIISLEVKGDSTVSERFLVEEPASETVSGVYTSRYVAIEVTDYTATEPPRTVLTLLSAVRHRVVGDEGFSPIIPPTGETLGLPDQANWIHRGSLMDLRRKESTMRCIAAAAFMLTDPSDR